MYSFYNSEQKSIFNQYKNENTAVLLDILAEKKLYVKDVIDVIKDILIERNTLADNEKYDRLIEIEKFQQDFENKKNNNEKLKAFIEEQKLNHENKVKELKKIGAEQKNALKEKEEQQIEKEKVLFENTYYLAREKRKDEVNNFIERFESKTNNELHLIIAKKNDYSIAAIDASFQLLVKRKILSKDLADSKLKDIEFDLFKKNKLLNEKNKEQSKNSSNQMIIGLGLIVQAIILAVVFENISENWSDGLRSISRFYVLGSIFSGIVAIGRGIWNKLQ